MYGCFESFNMLEIIFLEFFLTLRNSDLILIYRGSHRRCSVKKSFSEKILNIHRKTSMLESLFNNIVGLQASSLKETPTQVLYCEYWDIFRSIYFVKQLRTAAIIVIGLPLSFLKPVLIVCLTLS